MMSIVLFISGLALLVVGAEALVRGASRIASAAGISPLVIGLTVVAFGTSSPELAVSIKASLAGQGDLAVGNVVGSNIFNVLLILGLSAVIVPLLVAGQLVRFDVPLMVALSFLLLVLSLDQHLGRLDGAILLTGLAAYLFFLIRMSRRESAAVSAEFAKEFESAPERSVARWMLNIVLVVVGLALLVLGSRWLVESAVVFAQALGVSELVIGLTIVAAGTSLPELVTSIIAAVRGERDIAVGNVVGSNIFNIMGVLGVSCVVAPAGLEIPMAVLALDMPVMIVVACACLPIFFTGGTISRGEGAVLLFFYCAYTLHLVLASSHHDAAPVFSDMMVYFVIPLTLLTLTMLALNELRRRRARRISDSRDG